MWRIINADISNNVERIKKQKQKQKQKQNKNKNKTKTKTKQKQKQNKNKTKTKQKQNKNKTKFLLNTMKLFNKKCMLTVRIELTTFSLQD
jgi:enoyl reductase-like protein